MKTEKMLHPYINSINTDETITYKNDTELERLREDRKNLQLEFIKLKELLEQIKKTIDEYNG
tara:strand:+ start:193 stop:378 length:186 start_codon:yes stop_codon:yes gene_type:complete